MHKQFLKVAMTVLGLTWVVFAQPQESQTEVAPVFFAADAVSYGRTGGLVTASGNVELRQSGRAIRADKLVFSQRTEEVLASGNVVVQDVNGDLIHADEIALDRDFSRGFVKAIQLKLKPDFEIAGNYAERSGGNRLDAYKVVATPCPACKDNPKKERSWQIKAQQVVVDEQTEQVSYKNAVFEIKGVPVLYLPYFAHADPRTDRKTGFLNPGISIDSDKGYGVRMPYFIDVNERTNLRIEPTVFAGRFFSDTTNTGDDGLGALQVRTDFNRAFKTGQLNVTAHTVLENSGSYFDENFLASTDPDFNGSVNVSLSQGLTKNTRLSSDAAFYTDREYMNAVGINTATTSNRTLDLETFQRRSYASLNIRDQYALRDSLSVSADTYADTGRVLVDLKSDPFWGAGTYNIKARMNALHRPNGRDYGRAAVEATTEIPFVSASGIKTSFLLGGYSAYYNYQHADISDPLDISEGTDEGTGVQNHAAAAVRVQWPLIRQSKNTTQVFEPTLQLAFGTDPFTQDFIPNEDSVGLELDESNMFNLWRTNGYDKIDRGPRVDYGLSHSIRNKNRQVFRAFVGQSYALDHEAAYWNNNSGLEDALSNVVGTLELAPVEAVDLTWRARYDIEDHEFRRNDVDLALKGKRVSATFAYTALQASGAINATENASITLTAKPTDWLSASFNVHEDLNQPLNTRYGMNLSLQPTKALSLLASYAFDEKTDKTTIGGGFTYTGDCWVFGLNGQNTVDETGKRTNTASFRIGLRHLGDINLGSNALVETFNLDNEE